MNNKVLLNSDMGESFGIHTFGNDERLMEIIDLANVACGFHSGDPDGIAATVQAAGERGIHVGAHPGLPDLIGFGRRRIDISPAEARNIMIYQVGAILAFCQVNGLTLNHIKPHGTLYAMTAHDEGLMRACATVAKEFGTKYLGAPNTLHQRVCDDLGVEFVAELYVDLDYGDDGLVKVVRRPGVRTLDDVRARVRMALQDGQVEALSGKRIPMQFDSICIHSDTGGAVDVARAVQEELQVS